MIQAAEKLPILLLACVLGCALVWGVFAGLERAVLARPLVAVFPVTNTNDSGAGSLRLAIIGANLSPGADLIRITATGTILLLSPLPVISEAVAIQGPGAELLAVDGANTFRVFDLTTGGVTLADLTVQNGSASGAPGNGAGIRGTSGLTLSGVQVLSNTAQHYGGGLYLNGDLVINGGLFRNNHSTNGVGGGLCNLGMTTLSSTSFLSNTAWFSGGALVSAGDLLVSGGLFRANRCTDSFCQGGGLYSFSQTTLTGTQFLGNTAQNLGGGAFVDDDLTVINGLFQENQAVLGLGGGLYVSSATIQGTQFLSNTAQSLGGGIFSLGSLTVTHGVFAHNQAQIASGGGVNVLGSALVSGTLFLRNAAAEGGGISLNYGDGRIANSLFAENQATNGVGEALLLAPGGRVDVLHTTLVGTGLPGGAAIEVLTGTVGITNTLITRHTVGISSTGGVVSQDYNLFFGVGTRTLGVIAGGVHSFTGNPLFAAPRLDDYHLSPGSAAIDAGTKAGVAVDFEGEARPQNHDYDIGYDEILIVPEFWMYLPAVRK